MISNKEEFYSYTEADLAANNITKWKFKYRFLPSYSLIYFHKLLREIEYLQNCRKGIFHKTLFKLKKYRFLKLSVHLGFTIPPNVFGSGLSIAHYGSIIVNEKSKIGKNCRIHSATNIGGVGDNVPIIGDNVYIAPGAKIFGGITIGDNVSIGANAVVNKDVPSNVTVAGVPAKIVSYRNVEQLEHGISQSL